MSKTCKAALILVPAGGSATSIASGTKLSEAGVLKLTVTDEFENAASGDISLTAVAIYGLEALQQPADTLSSYPEEYIPQDAI